MSQGPPPHLSSPSQAPNIPDLDLDDPDEDITLAENTYREMTFEEILEDLNARFLVNLPREEMTLVRVYWQAEQAHWFYEDYLRPLNPTLPSYSQRNFTHLIIASSPLYSSIGDIDYDRIWVDYCDYKRMVPCCGGILINEGGDKCVMVRGLKNNAGWCFPRGKINSEESEVSCAIREVEEETGFSMTGWINPKDNIKTQINAQMVTMFIVGGVREDTVFKAQTRNEIGGIAWVPLVDLPTWSGKKGPRMGRKPDRRFYNVTPFVGPLKRWMTERGLPHFPKKKPQSQPLPAKTPLRPLQPFKFDSPAAPQPVPAPTQQSVATTALDNLFNRFITKQEEDLADRAPASVDSKAGLQRLFGSLDEVKTDDQDGKQDEGSTEKEKAEKKEDDALAKLLGGLSTTPAPIIPTLQPKPTEKQTKLLSLLNAPSPTPIESVVQPKADPIKPHQASLLAVLSPGRKTQTPTNEVLKEAVKPISLPTSPRPVDHGEEERKRRQRAMLEGITAGIGIDMPVSGPSGSQAMPSQTDIKVPAQPAQPFYEIPPQQPQITSVSAGPPRQPYIPHVNQVTGHIKSERPPPPPYDLFPFPHPVQGPHDLTRTAAGGPQLIGQPVNDHQRGLINALYATGPGPAQQPQQQPPPAQQQQQPQPPQARLNVTAFIPPQPYQSSFIPQQQQPQLQGQPAYLVYRPTPGHQPTIASYPNFHPAQPYAPPPQIQPAYRPHPVNNTNNTNNHSFLNNNNNNNHVQTGNNGLHHPLPPHPHAGGPLHQRQVGVGGGAGYPQPIPRVANSNGGVLLGMLNEGKGGTGK